ncbi:MAG: xanthine dehydrogenase family protein subunit M [Acidobacteria bacterium]|nr:xanthine dehydrogenase family protein subunit M [Acidobacteriota bacterium]
MYAAPFEYVCATSLSEAARLLHERQEDAKLLAGGQSLIPLLKLRLAAPAVVIDIGRLVELKGICETAEGIEIGALVRHAEIEKSELLARYCPLLPETATEVGDLPVRNRGTFGGSLAHADPAGDFPAAVLALEAKFIATSVNGQRTISAQEFFIDLMTTALQPNEILKTILVPKLGARTGSAYVKMRQQASGFAIVGIASVVKLDARGRIEEARVAITGVAPVPYRASAVENKLRGVKPEAGTISQAAAGATDGVDVSGDLHASAEFRRELAAIFTRRSLANAAERASQARTA